MTGFYELKDKTCCPPGGFVFKQRDGNVFSIPYFSGAIEACRSQYKLNEDDASQQVLKETYLNIPQPAREYFIVKNTEALVIQNPTFRYVDRQYLLEAPFCYNPSLVTKDGDDWLIYRRQLHNSDSTICRMNFRTHENATIEIPAIYEKEQFEDPRCLWHNGNIHICFSSWRKTWNYKPLMRLVSLNDDWTFKEEIPLDFGGNGKGVIQKNWQYFSHEEKLHFVYWYDPFQVVEGHSIYEGKSLKWSYGDVRGGTPPVLVDGVYYTFFHSRTDGGRAKYYMGCMSFEGKTPFKPISMTKKPLLTATNKEPSLHWAPLVTFPCGSLFKDGRWCVSLGINDVNCALVDYQHDELIKLMEAI